MEPLSETELNDLLRRWQAPQAPASLAARVLPPRPPWWRWILAGTVRVPVPVGLALLVAVAALLLFRPQPRPTVTAPVKPVSLADFQPVKQLEPRVIRRINESN